MNEPTLVVIGAGVSGLAAASNAVQEAENAGVRIRVIVLERDRQVGGRARCYRQDGWLMEAGPSGYLDTDPAVAELVQRVGLADRLVRASRAAARRYIYHRGHLHVLGPNPLGLARLLGAGGALRLLAEPFVPARTAGEDETVLSFFGRRFGDKFADRVIRTAMLGIFAGDAERLSIESCFPEVSVLEREHGSVIRGAMARRRQHRRHGPPAGAVPARRLSSFVGGLQELPKALATDARIEVRTGARVLPIQPYPGHGAAQAPGSGPGGPRFLVPTEGYDPVAADVVVVATPAQVSAQLLAAVAPAAARLLAQIPTPPVAVLGLGFDPDAVGNVPEGFGMLVARGQQLRMLGSLWESRVYPARAPDGSLLMRVMFGGRCDERILELDDDGLLRLALEELRTTLGITQAPAFTRLVRWPRAIPQYEQGHPARRSAVQQELETIPGLLLAGDALEGVSFVKTAACGLRQGAAAARILAAR